MAAQDQPASPGFFYLCKVLSNSFGRDNVSLEECLLKLTLEQRLFFQIQFLLAWNKHNLISLKIGFSFLDLFI